MAGQVGQLLLKGLFIIVTLPGIHHSLPASVVTRPRRNNEAHPSSLQLRWIDIYAYAYTDTHIHRQIRHKDPRKDSPHIHRLTHTHMTMDGSSYLPLPSGKVESETVSSSKKISVNQFQASVPPYNHTFHFTHCCLIDYGNNYPLICVGCIKWIPPLLANN